MSHKMIFNNFKGIFGGLAELVYEWFPHGKGAIRLRIAGKGEFIFEYTSPKQWCLMTREKWLDKKEKM